MESTKTYSNLQETRISNYLGWDKVPASGARSFHPGDIQSEDWLGECKTHVKKTDDVIFNLSVWKKLTVEAMSIGKRPVLFVDNGSQDIHSTWVLFEKCLAPENLKHYDLVDCLIGVNKNIKYSTAYLDTLKPKQIITKSWRNVGSILILRLDTFKELIEN